MKPLSGDTKFDFTGLCISAFGEATVQHPPFMARGSAGSGLIVLEPLKPLDDDILLWYAAYFNKSVCWRFSYGRMVSSKRLERIKLVPPDDVPVIPVKANVPTSIITSASYPKMNMSYYPLSKIFDPISGDYHKAEDLPDGDIPLVSCGEGNNGIIRYCSVPNNHIYQNALTVAYNGQPLTTKYHPYQFAAKDDVAVLLPKIPLKNSTLLFVQMMLNREQWRYSYGRKCFKAKLIKMQIYLPLKNNMVDEISIELLMQNTSYWDFLSPMVFDSEIKSGTQLTF